MEDKQILTLLWNRAESAISALAGRFGRRLHQTAMNILGILQDAEECVNDTYLAIWNVVPPQRPDPLAPYVYRTGRNIALKRLRANTAQKRYAGYEVSLDELAACIPGSSMEEALDARLLGQAIDRFLETQSRESRVVFLRRFWFSDSVRDIARQLGMTENAVSVRLSRTKAKLRDYLIKEGICNEA